MSLLVVGSVAYDTLETPAGRADDALGGSATHFSLAARVSSAGQVPVQLVAVVGEDFRDADIALLRAQGVDLEGLQRAPGRTFRWGGRYSEGFTSRTTLFTELNVFEHFRPQIPASFRDARWVFLANIDPELQLSVLDQIDRPEFVACDTMNFWIGGPKRPALLRLLPRVSCLVLNDEEALELASATSVVGAARRIQAMGPRVVIIKRGEHGALMLDGDSVFYSPAYPLEQVVDPTGAGDSFAGGMMASLWRAGSTSGEALRQAVWTGTLVASFCVEGFGTDGVRAATPAHLRERAAALRDLVRCSPLDLPHA